MHRFNLLAAAFFGLTLSVAPAHAQLDPNTPGGKKLQDAKERQLEEAVKAQQNSSIFQVEPGIIEFGTMQLGDVDRKNVTITNISDSPFSIARGFATCGCTVPSIPDEAIEPGGSIAIPIEFTAKNEGAQSTTVRFYLTDRLGEIRVGVKAHVRPAIEVKPQTYDVKAEEDQKITVVSTNGKPFRIMGAVPEVVDGLDEKPRVEHTIVISAEKLARFENRNAYVRLYFDHPRIDTYLLKSNKFHTSPEAQRLIAWSKGEGELEDLIEILDNGGDVHQTDVRGMTPLMYAAINGNPERVLALLDFGANVNDRRNDGWTALMGAAQSRAGGVETVGILLDAGANIFARDRFGRTALLWAARSGDAERIQLLLDAGSEIDVSGPSNESPLIAAVKSKEIENVRVLVNNGADLFATDSRGRNALDHAKVLAAVVRGPSKPKLEEIVQYLQKIYNEARSG